MGWNRRGATDRPKLRILPAVLAAAAAVWLGTGSASAQVQATGSLAIDRPGPVIAPEIYGQFMEQLGTGIDGGVWVGEDSVIPNTHGYRNDVVEALKALHVPVLRWPGGCYADIYHWRDGIGPRQSRPVTLNRWWGNKEEDNAFGTHEFFEFASLIGAKTYLSVNLGSGTPSEAADWIEYITASGHSRLAEMRRANGRDAPWKIDYVGVGNEPWGCGGRMRPAYYADLLNQYIGFVAPPGTAIVAAGPNADDYNWTRTVMAAAHQNINALSLHYYTLPTGEWTSKGPALGFDKDQWARTFAQTYRIEAMIVGHDAAMDETDAAQAVALAADEWGAWYDPTPGTNAGYLQQQNSLRDALLAGVNLNIFHRHADRVRMANVAQMVNVLQAMILTDGPKMVLTPTYYAFSLYRPFQGATSLPITIEAPQYTEGQTRLPMIDATAARGLDGRIHLAFVNLDPEHAASVRITLEGVHGGTVSGQVLTADRMDAHNGFDTQPTVAPAAFTGARIRGEVLSADLPAKSLVVLTLE